MKEIRPSSTSYETLPTPSIFEQLSSDEIKRRVMDAAITKNLSDHTIAAYNRTWKAIVAWASGNDLILSALSKELADEFYQQHTRDNGASYHLQVKSALTLLYRVINAPNPFTECISPKFQIDKIQIKHQTAVQLASVLKVLRSKDDYYGRLTYHLAEALFLTACRYHEWAELTMERIVPGANGDLTARIKAKGGYYRDLPLSKTLAASLRTWVSFLDGIRGVRLRRGAIDFAGSNLVFPGRDGSSFTNQAFNKRLKNACREANVKPAFTAHSLRHTAATLLLNEKNRNLREVQNLLGHKSLATTARYTHVDYQRFKSVIDDLEGFGR